MQIRTKIVSRHTADSKPVKQEVNGTVILPPLVFPGSIAHKALSVPSCSLYVYTTISVVHMGRKPPLALVLKLITTFLRYFIQCISLISSPAFVPSILLIPFNQFWAQAQGDQIGRNFAIWAIFYGIGQFFYRKNSPMI